MSTQREPRKGDVWRQHRSTYRLNGVDYPADWKVTSVNRSTRTVYMVPTWATPGPCRPTDFDLDGNARFVRAPFVDRFDLIECDDCRAGIVHTHGVDPVTPEQ